MKGIQREFTSFSDDLHNLRMQLLSLKVESIANRPARQPRVVIREKR